MNRSNNNLVDNNTISNTLQLHGGNEVGGFALDLGDSWNNTISHNQLSGTVCVWLQGGSSDNTIAGNNMTPFQEAVYVEAGLSNRILSNSIHVMAQQSGGEGFYLTSAHNSTIAGNTISGGQGTGMFLYGTSGSRILNNIISTSAYEEISLYGSQNNTLSGNHITNTERGISLDYLSNGNTISDNEIMANATLFGDCCGNGIYVKDSSHNSIFHNNFYGGDLGPYDNGSNTWYSQGKGNYWSLHRGTDSDGDGIIDQPYKIQPNGTDQYPLVNPVSISPATVVNTPFAPLPQNLMVPNLTNMAIINKTVVMGSGNADISKSMTIENSVVTLGTNGSFGVNLESGATLLIEHSTVYWD